MKYLKIILIFVVFVGAIVLVMNWKSIGSSVSGGEEFSTSDKIDVENRCNTFREQWSNSKSWDPALYDRQSGQVEAWKTQKLLSERGYNTLSTVVREQAIRKIDKSYRSLLTATNYDHNKMVEVYKGVGYMKSKEKNIDSDFKEIDGIHSLYLKIKSYVGSPHNIVPSFNSETGEWSSFTAKRNNILSEATSYRNNKYFSELKNIPGFQDGLNAEKLQNQIEGKKPAYYQSLSNIIVREIEQATPSTENYQKMKNVFERYAQEDSKNSTKVFDALNAMKQNIPSE